ncbi:MAG: Holliday junction resolvase RuvX [Thermoguttaceae bacterium]
MSSLGRVAGIDYGTVRIGIAISDPDRILSSPYETYIRKSPHKDEEYFKKLVSEDRVVQFVVGLPLHMSGDESGKSAEVRAFAEWLTQITGVSVDFVDERFTSTDADEFMRGAKLTNQKRKERRDKIAAQIILSKYLTSGGKTAEEMGAVG